MYTLLTFFGALFGRGITGIQAAIETGQTVDEAINSVMAPITAAVMKVIFFTLPIGGGMSVPFVLIWLVLYLALKRHLIKMKFLFMQTLI